LFWVNKTLHELKKNIFDMLIETPITRVGSSNLIGHNTVNISGIFLAVHGFTSRTAIPSTQFPKFMLPPGSYKYTDVYPGIDISGIR